MKEHLEPQMTNTVVLAELYGPEPEGIFSFLDKQYKPANLKTCYGDLIIMINALMDYANLLDIAVEDWSLEGFHASSYRSHAQRCRKISQQYASAIGYDYDCAVENCQKKREKQREKGDIGEEALTAAYYKRVKEAENKTQIEKEKRN